MKNGDRVRRNRDKETGEIESLKQCWGKKKRKEGETAREIDRERER